MPDLVAGVGRRSIAPPLGIKTAGFYSREGVVTAHEDELVADVCVLRCGDDTVAIAAMDLCMAPQPLVAEWRASIAEVAGTTAAHVLVNLSHTHSGAALAATQPEFAFQADLLDRYQATLGEALAGAAAEAVAGLRPARVGAATGASGMGMQRRELGDDGYVFLGEVPDGPIDPAVGVVRVDELDGAPIAILVAYGCHPVTVGPRASVASADFAAPLRAHVERVLGGTCLFLQGGGGDIMPRWGMGHELDNRDGKERIGLMVGGEAVAVAAGIRTHVTRGERVSIPSLLGPGQTMRPLVPASDAGCSVIDARSRSVTLDLVDLPSEERALGLRHERQADLDRAVETGSERAIQIARHFVAWADVLVAAVREGRTTASMEVQAIRIDDVAITGIAAEVFSATTRAIRDGSPAAQTLALGYSNGMLCYLPPREAYPPEGWDVNDRYRIPDLVFQSYLLPVALSPDSEERVKDAVVTLIEELY